MNQPDLFHRIADTSLEAFAEIAPTLAHREQLVLDALGTFREPPTAYEIFTYMRSIGTATDVNSTRPRLSSLAAKGRVVSVAKRRCRVTGRTAYAWRVAS